MCERKDPRLNVPLVHACDLIFQEITAYYKANRGTGWNEQNPSNFFRQKKGRHKEFEEWQWTKGRTTDFDKAWTKVEKAIIGEVE